MTPPRRAKLVLLVLAVALVGLGVWAWVNAGPLYWWVMTERVYVERVDSEGYRVRGYRGRSRWGDDDRLPLLVLWYVDTGLMANKSVHGEQPRATTWRHDGTVNCQLGHDRARLRGGPTLWSRPPWLWGVTDQTEPSMPAWMKDDALWQAALDAQE